MGTRHWKRILVSPIGPLSSANAAGHRGLRSGAQSWYARRVLTAEIRAAEKGKMESGPKTLRALDKVQKPQGDTFSAGVTTHRFTLGAHTFQLVM